jgi:hypothetical protein
MPTKQDLIILFGLLLETMPRVALVLASALFALAAAFQFGRAVRAGRRFAMIGTWLPGLAAGDAACVAFACFVYAGTAATDIDPLTIVGLLASPCRRAARASSSAESKIMQDCYRRRLAPTTIDIGLARRSRRAPLIAQSVPPCLLTTQSARVEAVRDR